MFMEFFIIMITLLLHSLGPFLLCRVSLKRTISRSLIITNVFVNVIALLLLFHCTLFIYIYISGL